MEVAALADSIASLASPPAVWAGAAAVLARQRRLLWSLAVGGALLLLGSSSWFAWYVRASDIEVASAFAERRAGRLATEIEQALKIAGTAIDQTERVLQRVPPGASAAGALDAAARERAQLLRALELPFEIQALDAQGRVIAGLERSGPVRNLLGPAQPSSPATADRWRVGDPVLAGMPPQRYLPVLRRAAPAAQGAAWYAVLFLHSALVARFDEERMSGGGAVLFRIERDGSAITILARAPFVETELGRRVTGPLWRALPRKAAGRFSDRTQIDNVERIVGYRRLPGAGADMVLAYGIETAAVLADWRAALPVQAGITLALCALLLLGTQRLDRSLRDSAANAAALARSENQFRTLADNLPDVLLRYDSEGRYLYANPAIEAATGLPRAAFIGRTNAALGIPRVDGRQWALVRRRAFESGQAQHIEFSFRGPRGERLLDAVLVPEPGADGQPGTALVICRDITDQRQLELALRASQARLQYLLANAPVVIYSARMGDDFVATYYSDNLPELLGYEPLQVIGDPGFWLAHVHDEDRAAVQHLRVRLSSQGTQVLEYRFRHGDGSWRWLRDSVRLVRDEAGVALDLIGSLTDISARREAEDEVRRLNAELEQRVQQRTAQLARSEARLRNIFETVPASIGEEDWSRVKQMLRALRQQGVRDGPAYFAAHPEFVQDCLRAVELLSMNREMLGLHQARSQRGEPPDAQAVYGTPDNLPQFVGELEALWAGQRRYTGRKSLTTADGRPLSLMVTMLLPPAEGDEGLALVCFVDITELDRLHAELDASLAQLRRTNRELETFTYSVSHDLKAPLRAIDGYSRLLLSDHEARLDAEGRGFLANIRQASQQMAQLIDDLLAYSQLERRNQELAPLALDAAVRSVLAPYEDELRRRGVEITTAIPAGLRAHGDAQSLALALRNLVDNALKFSHASTPPMIEITGTRTGEAVVVSVHDNGVGFDMKFHDRIFDIFQRLHRAEDYPGTGVGLAIVRKAMERMGGQVWAQSQTGQGATFYLRMPVAP